MTQSWIVALDGGTTTTRARLLQGDRVVATARRAVGVRDAFVGSSREALARAVHDAIAEACRQGGVSRPDRIVAAGMLTADVGLCSIPHVSTPAGLAELAEAAVERRVDEVGEQPILFVPGIKTPARPGPDGWTAADLMRGEECETLGAWLALRQDRAPALSAFLWPGSHTKLVLVDEQGRIVASQTTLAGEMLAALAGHTLLAASLPADWPDPLPAEPLEQGARIARREGLGRASFLVRVADLARALTAPERLAFLVGAVIADDAACLGRHPMLAGSIPVWVGGRQPQRSLYRRWLAETHGGPVEDLGDAISDSASARGALAVAAAWHDSKLRSRLQP